MWNLFAPATATMPVTECRKIVTVTPSGHPEVGKILRLKNVTPAAGVAPGHLRLLGGLRRSGRPVLLRNGSVEPQSGRPRFLSAAAAAALARRTSRKVWIRRSHD